MKSTTLNNKNSKIEPLLETELKFDSGITRAMLSGINRHTIRLGKRKFATHINIHGHSATVNWYKHTSLLHIDMELLTRDFGFKTMFNALLELQRFYPGKIDINTTITIVQFRLDVY